MATNTILNVLCWATQYVLCEFMKGLKPDPTKIFKFQLFRGYLHGFSYATHIYSGRLLLGQEYCIFTWSCYGPHVPCDWCPHFKRGGSFGHIYIYIIFSNSTWPSTVWIVPTAYFVENFGAILVFSFAYFKFHFLFIPLALVDQNLCLLLIYVSWQLESLA